MRVICAANVSEPPGCAQGMIPSDRSAISQICARHLSVWLYNYRFSCFLPFLFSPFSFFSGKAKQKVAEYAENFRETFKNPLPNAEKCVII